MQVDPSRQALSFVATKCACSNCAVNCKFIPGYLIPEDLQHLWNRVEPELPYEEFAKKYLLASPGALVGTADGQVGRIPMIVPARKPEGGCVFLTEDNKCSIHESAPFGCRFFDAHMSDAEADRRSMAGLMEILKDNKTRGTYKTTWDLLNDAKLCAPSAADSRKAMQEYIEGSLKLPCAMESLEQNKARLCKAFSPLVPVKYDEEDKPIYRPGQHRRHVFDFNDGVRLIISRDEFDPMRNTDGVVLHISASFEPHTAMYHRLETLVRKQGVLKMKDRFVEMITELFRILTGYKISVAPVWTDSGKGIPHWFVSWQEFSEATGLTPEE